MPAAGQAMVSAMTNPDPTAQPTMDAVLASAFWQETDEPL